MRQFTKVVILMGFLLGAFVALKGFVLAIPSGTWQSTGNLSAARPGASAALLQNGSVLITGGDPGSGPVASADLFNSDGSVSPLAAPMNNPRSNHISATLQDGRVLVAGGTVSGGGATNSAEIFDPLSGTWGSIAGGMVEARSGATAALLQDGRVLIAGGESSGVASATLEIFDPVAGTFSAAGVMSSPRTKHAMAMLADGRVIMIGGSNGTAPVASTDILNPVAGSVAPGPSLASPRSGHSAATLLDGRVLVVGGNNIVTNADGSTTTVDLSSAEIFDPTAGTFTTSASALATARAGHLAFLLPHNNNVLIVGGTSNGVSISSAELFTPWQGTFSATASMSVARSNAAGSAMQQDGLFLVAGGNDAATPPSALASTEVYGFATVKTDQADYAPGTIVTITGSGWQPGETVTLSFLESPLVDTHPNLTAVADANGNISNSQFSPDSHDIGILFYLTARGATSQAQTTFTDSGNLTYNPASTSLSVNVSGGSASTSFSQEITAPKNNATFTVTPLLAGTGTKPIPASWFSTLPGSLIFVTTSSNGDTHSWTVTFTVPSTAAAGTYTGNVKGHAGSGPNDGQGTDVTLAVTNTTSLSVNSVTAVYGETVNLSATLTSGSPAVGESGQTITFTLNGNAAGSGTTNSSGVATSSASLGTIAPGTNPTGVQANFAGNGLILASSASNSLTVNKASTTTTITAPGLNPATNVGQSYTVSWTGTAVAPGSGTPTGTVTVSDGTDGCSAAVGAGSCLLTSNTAGSPKTLTATYSGDTIFIGSSGTQAHNVNQVAASTAVSSSQNPSVFGQSVSFTANLTGAGATPTGTVQFKVDGVNLDGLATLVAGVATSMSTTTITVAGSPHTITADYSGDPNYNSGTGTLAGGLTVNKASATAAITADTPDPSVVGQVVPVHYTVSVTAPGGGTIPGTDNVSVTDGVDSCTGTVTAGQCTLTFNTAGARTLKATYQGSSNYNASPASPGEPHQVIAADTTTTLQSSQPVSSVFGQSVTFTATVAASAPGGGAPAGNVNFYDGGSCGTPGLAVGTNPVALSGGQATASSSTLSVTGSPHSILACYLGNSNYNVSNGTTSQTVNKADTSVAITSDTPDPSVVGQAVTVNFTVSVTAPGSGTPTGNVQVTDGVDSCTDTVAVGQCKVTLTTAGARTLKATYQGDGANYNASPASPGQSHTVDTPASLSYTTSVAFDSSATPADTIVRATQSVIVKLTITNSGQSGATGVTPPSMSFSATGTANTTPCGSGSPASGNIAGTGGPGPNTMSYNYSCGPVSGDGTIKFTTSGQASGKDAISGNTVSTTGSIDSNLVTVDSTAPTVSITGQPSNPTISTNANFTFTATDPIAPTVGGVSSGVASVQCKLDAGSFATCASATSQSYSGLAVGSHTFQVEAVDIAGNTGTLASFTWSIVTDITPPTTAITLNPLAPNGSNNWYKTDVGVSVSAIDNVGGTGVAETRCVLDPGSAPATFDAILAGCAYLSPGANVTTEGQHALYAASKDNAGNKETPKSASFMIDKTAPVIAAHADVTAEATSAAGAIVNYTSPATSDAVDGAGTASCLLASGSTFPLGDTTVTCNKSDAAGNAAIATTFKVTVRDTTPPVIAAHADVIAEATSAAGAIVNYTSPATSDAVDGPGTASCLLASGSTFPLGDTTVTCNKSDAAGNAAISTTFKVTVQDTTPPSLSLPSPITAEATEPSGAAVTYSATATDLVDGAVAVVCSPSSGSTFALGTSTVSCSASDAHHNTASGSFTVTVHDTTPPALSLPSDFTKEATGPTGAIATYSASATDLVDGTRPVTCTPASGSTFAFGTTTVSCSSSDTHGNTATGSFHVTIEDTTPPTVTVPSDITAEATSAAGAAVSFSASATDIVDGAVAVTCTSASGSTFALGITPVTCSATDAHGNTGSKSFKVTVQDTTPPTISGTPANTTLEASGPSGAVASYTNPSASDLVDGAVAVICSPASGSIFALGTTTVNCSTTDAHGNKATASFTVTVRDTTPPTVTVPSDITAEATSAAGAAVTYAASATDLVDGTVTPVCAPASGATFALGMTTVTCTATDKAGNTSAAKTFKVTVQDTTPPVIAAHADVIAEATSAAGAVVNYTAPTTSDAVDGAGTASCLPGSGSQFALGDTTVTCSATDAHGNAATPRTFVVHVRDTTPPVIAAHADVIAEATSSAGAIVAYTSPATSDAVDGAGTASCLPGSGSQFALGDTTVTCNAKDAHSNAAVPRTFVVHVRYGGVSGILQPINPDNSSVFKRGQAIPVKFQLARDEYFGFQTAGWRVQGFQVACTDQSAIANEDLGSVTPSTVFRYDPTADQYIYNADFRSAPVGSCWRVVVTLDDAFTVMNSAYFKIGK